MDDGWCLDDEPAVSAPTLTLVPPAPEPSIDMLLSAAEAAFFADGEVMHETKVDNDFSDLCDAPERTFWQRLFRRA